MEEQQNGDKLPFMVHLLCWRQLVRSAHWQYLVRLAHWQYLVRSAHWQYLQLLQLNDKIDQYARHV